MMRASAGGKVFAFEPHPDVFEHLKDNVDRIRQHQQNVASVQLHNFALSDRSGSSTLVLNDAATGVRFSENEGVSRIGEPKPGEEAVEVMTHSLDQVMGEMHVDVMKIDVEGHELQVLQGAKSMLRSGQVENIVFEDHNGWVVMCIIFWLRADTIFIDWVDLY